MDDKERKKRMKESMGKKLGEKAKELLKRIREQNSRRKQFGKTTIISGFPGIGKSSAFRKMEEMGLKIADSDSSEFSWIYNEDGTKERNPDFIRDYQIHIDSLRGDADVICVSSHEDVYNMLINNGIPFFLVYPSKDRKEEFIQNYIDRGNDNAFVELLKTNWDNWITALEKVESPKVTKVELRYPNFLSDLIKDICGK